MANMTRWDPFQNVLTLREAMNQLFEESVVPPAVAGRGNGFVPALDLSETADGYLVELTVPGLKAEDLEITVENNVLTVKGEIKQAERNQGQNYHRVERRFGSFSRTIGLPTTVKNDEIQANLSEGILRLNLPKAEAVKPRKISINVASNN